jgi:MEMO1 family protein
MVGNLKKDKLPDFANLLLKLFLDQKNLFVVSTDFCHWGQNFDYYTMVPGESVVHKSIEKLDKQGMALIEKQ